MIELRFEPYAENNDPTKVLRHIRCVPNSAEESDVISLTSDLLPRWGQPFITDLHTLPERELRTIGQRIFSLAFGPNAADRLQPFRASGKLIIRIQENPFTPLAIAVPWELMHDDKGFLAADPATAIIRSPTPDFCPRMWHIRRPLRALFFWAAPRDQDPVGIEREQMRLSLVLAPHRVLHNIIDYEVLHATRSTLHAALEEGQYDLIYFTGHGDLRNGQGVLCLENESGGTELLPAAEFAAMLADHPPALLFLNCCLSAGVGRHNDMQVLAGQFSDVGRQALAAGTGQVVATLTPVFMAGAREFTSAFFSALLIGPGLPTAHAVACGRLALLQSPDVDDEVRHSFFQFLLLGDPFEVTIETVAERPIEHRSAPQAGILTVSPRHPAMLRSEAVWRNDLLTRIERHFRAGARMVGLFGVGGLGKTWVSAQLELHLVRHPESALRANRAIWIDFHRERHSSADLANQLAQILTLIGDHAAAKQLEREPDMSPAALAQLLVERLGNNCLLTLDNAENLLNDEHEITDPALQKILISLASISDWRTLITSRHQFGLEQNKQTPDIKWIPAKGMGYNESAALLLSTAEQQKIDWKRFPQETIHILLKEVAYHPLELKLFLASLTSDSDIEALVKKIHHSTSNYAELHRYIDPLPSSQQRLLHLLARLEEAEDEEFLGVAWSAVGEERHFAMLAGLFANLLIPTSLSALCEAGLIESDGTRYWLLPILRHHLLHPRHSVDSTKYRDWNIRIAYTYIAEARELQDKEKELFREQDHQAPPPEMLANLSARRIECLERAIRQGLLQKDIESTCMLFQEAAPQLSSQRLLLTSLVTQFKDQLWKVYNASGRSPILGTAFAILGNLYIQLSQWTNALETFKHARGLCEHQGNYYDLGGIWHGLGVAYQGHSMWHESIHSYQTALDLFKQSGQDERLGTTWHQIGQCYQKQEDWPKALSAYQKALSIYEQMKQYIELPGTWSEIGEIHLNTLNLEKAEHAYRTALDWCHRTEQHTSIGKICHDMGILHEAQYNWQDALSAYDSAVSWNRQTGQPELVGINYHQMGIVHHKLGKFGAALECYEEALKWKEKFNQDDLIGSTWHQAGMAYASMQRWTEALDAYKQSITWSTQTEQLQELANTWHQLGVLYQSLHHFQDALESYNESIECDKKSGNLHELGGTWHQIGMTHQQQQRWPDALEAYQQALYWKKKTGQHQQLGTTWYQIATTHVAQGAALSAASDFRTALELMRAHGAMPEHIYHTFASAYRFAKSNPNSPELAELQNFLKEFREI